MIYRYGIVFIMGCVLETPVPNLLNYKLAVWCDNANLCQLFLLCNSNIHLHRRFVNNFYFQDIFGKLICAVYLNINKTNLRWFTNIYIIGIYIRKGHRLAVISIGHGLLLSFKLFIIFLISYFFNVPVSVIFSSSAYTRFWSSTLSWFSNLCEEKP